MDKIVFRIYVAGSSSRNKELAAIYKRICSEKLPPHKYSVELVDIVNKPSEAERLKILATPIIIRHQPDPIKRVIGDFRDPAKAMQVFSFLTEDITNNNHE